MPGRPQHSAGTLTLAPAGKSSKTSMPGRVAAILHCVAIYSLRTSQRDGEAGGRPQRAGSGKRGARSRAELQVKSTRLGQAGPGWDLTKLPRADQRMNEKGRLQEASVGAPLPLPRIPILCDHDDARRPHPWAGLLSSPRGGHHGADFFKRPLPCLFPRWFQSWLPWSTIPNSVKPTSPERLLLLGSGSRTHVDGTYCVPSGGRQSPVGWQPRSHPPSSLHLAIQARLSVWEED